MASSTFKLAIIGAGGIANAHAGAIKSSGGRLALAAVVDPVEANRNKLAEAHGAKGFATIEELISAKKGGLEVHGVVVCTPPSVRVPIVHQALEAGLHVLSEKPLAHTAADARTLAGLADRFPKLVAAVGYCHRFTPAIIQMNELVAQGKIGRLTRFENAFACDLPGHESKWMSDPKVAGGGAFIDMGCHSLDLFHYMVGPSTVRGAVFDYKWSGRTESGATVLVASAKSGGPNVYSGTAGVILSGWAETCRFTIALFGTTGSFHYDYEKPEELVHKNLDGKPEVHKVESHEVRFARQLVGFADAAQGGPIGRLATFRDGLDAAEVVEQANKFSH
jgi:predicted dehydrogenase